MVREQHIATLAEGHPGADLRHADMAEADLRGRSFVSVCLAGARFDGAQLEGAVFRHCDLTGASFRGADVTSTAFDYVEAPSVNFDEARATGMQWQRSTLGVASFAGARLKRARFVSCELVDASFERADLTLASLVACSVDRARFTEALLRHTETIHSTFYDVDLTATREFAYSREIVIEVLRRHTEPELEVMKLVGAVVMVRTWCYPVWARLLSEQPTFFALATKIFGAYPASGCLEAFVDGLKMPDR